MPIGRTWFNAARRSKGEASSLSVQLSNQLKTLGLDYSDAGLIGRDRALGLTAMDPTYKLPERKTREGHDGADPLRILVVDDSATSRKLAEYAFEGKPYDIFFAEDGRRALQLISERNPDIVITDWLMPDLSGIDLCRLIRQKLQRKDIYLMLLTSNSGQGDVAKGMASGADSYLTKPLQADKLFAEIHMARAVIKARRDGNPHAMPIPRLST